MSPNTKTKLLHVGVPTLLSVAVAALLGTLLRPAEQAPTAPPIAQTSAVTAPSPTAAVVATAQEAVVVVQPPPDPIHYAPLPPLPPGTTTDDLTDKYVAELCACDDMACAQAARIKHNRYFGQAIPAHAPPNAERSDRMNACIQRLIEEDGG